MSEQENKITEYLCPYCAKPLQDFDQLKSHVTKEHPNEPAKRPEGMIRLTVNGEKYEVRVEPEWTLSHVVHDILGFTSIKTFCDRGACGSCTVIMDGRPILSCMRLAAECDGKIIETAEGIAKQKHPLIETYVDNHAMQCGYCTPGFVVTSKALLDKNPDPSNDEIADALTGNLCRCGTYPQHIKAVRAAADKINKQGGQV